MSVNGELNVLFIQVHYWNLIFPIISCFLLNYTLIDYLSRIAGVGLPAFLVGAEEGLNSGESF